MRRGVVQRVRMQRTAELPSRVVYTGSYVVYLLVSAVVAGCGGAGAGDGTSTAAVSATNPQTAGSSGSSSATATNSPPTISGTPGTQVQTGQAYSFTPSANDSDGHKLTFSVLNGPSWASFSTTSGQLSGTPSSAQAGNYANFVISVSDGTTSASLPPFSITVNAVPAGTGSATVKWNAPATNTDGSTIVNLAGYQIDYGTSASSLIQSVTISDPTATSYTLEGLATGTWYFAVSDFTSAGTVSALSTVVSKTIQ